MRRETILFIKRENLRGGMLPEVLQQCSTGLCPGIA
jgi:hypothetical protein